MDQRGTLGERIARFRKKRGLSQDALAAELDVTRSIVSAWENDRRRPRRDKLAALDVALGTTDEFVSWPLDHESDDATPVLEAPIPIGRLQRDVASALVGCMSTGEPAVAGGGYGWSQNLDDAGRPASAMATAYGVRTLLMNGGGGWDLDLARIRAQLRTLESPHGGWAPFTSSAPARPEVTAAVVAALRAAGEDEGYVRERIALLLEMLAKRAAIQRFERPYVLAASLQVLGRLPVDGAAVRRHVDDLVDMSTLDGDGRWWPVVVKSTAIAAPPSTAHTARAVCALAAWAERTGDEAMLSAAEAGRRWLERHAAFDLEHETILTTRADGGEEPLPVKHFTPAWVLRAVVAAGGDPDALIVRRALRATLSFYSPEVALWRWPSDGGILPVWMSYHGLSSLATWALARRID